MSRLRRRTLFKILNGIILLFFISLIYVYRNHKHHQLNQQWLNERRHLIKRYEIQNQKRQAVHSPGLPPACVVPQLDPFSPDILDFMEYRNITCPLKRYGKIKEGKLFLKASDGMEYVSLQYIRRAWKDGEINEDHNVSLSENIVIAKNEKGDFEHELTEAFLKLKMTVLGKQHVEYHCHIIKSEEKLKGVKKLKDLTTGIPLNIVLLMYDSQSNANFHRQLITSTQTLISDEDTIILKGLTIVGDGTTAQVAAQLIGMHEKDLSEARRGFNNTGPCDKYNFIFKDFHKAGYATLWSEDSPGTAIFNYRLNGFNKPPTTWYLRPYWLGRYEFDDYGKCAVEDNNYILQDFTKKFEDEAKFAYISSAGLTHNKLNNLQVLDADTLEIIHFFKEPERIDNTMLIIFGDHGTRTSAFRSTLQGKLEERLPWLSITLPPSFKSRYPDLFKIIQKNSEILTSHFDIYATFRHMLTYPKLPQEQLIGQSLFTPINPLTRTCESCGVLEHWCPCLSYTAISGNDPEIVQSAKLVVDFINKEVGKIGEKSKLCAKLKLHKVISAGSRTPNEKVQIFVESKRNEECDSCGLVLDEKNRAKGIVKVYEISFSVLPSYGTYEANVKVSGESLVVDPNISRTNLYGKQPACVAGQYPHIRPYCYCK